MVNFWSQHFSSLAACSSDISEPSQSLVFTLPLNTKITTLRTTVYQAKRPQRFPPRASTSPPRYRACHTKSLNWVPVSLEFSSKRSSSAQSCPCRPASQGSPQQTKLSPDVLHPRGFESRNMSVKKLLSQGCWEKIDKSKGNLGFWGSSQILLLVIRKSCCIDFF